MKTHAMVITGLAACLLVTAPRPVWAQAAEQDRPRAQEARDGQEGRDTRAGERLRLRAGARGQALSEEQDEVMQFMREHSPNRVRAMESLPENGAARRGVMAFVLARYRALQAVKDEDPKLYDIKVKEVDAEDELYGLVSAARTVADREKMRQQIQAATRKLVEGNLAEREERLQRLRESLEREEQTLRADRAQLDTIAEVRANVLVQEGAPALRREMMRRGFREDMRGAREALREGRPAGATTQPAEQ